MQSLRQGFEFHEESQGESEAFGGRTQEEASEGLVLGKPQLCKDPFPDKSPSLVPSVET